MIPSNAHCIVEIAGRRYDSWKDEVLITEATVELTSDKSGEATIAVFDPKFKFTDRHLSVDGLARVTGRFWMGFGSNLGQSLFKGTLARAEYADSISTLRFHDKSADMRKEKKSRYHNKTTDLKLLRKLATDNGMTLVLLGSVTDSDQYESIMQDGRTDWSMALKIAERAGLRLFVRDDTLFAKAAAQTAAPAATLEWLKDFIMLRNFGLCYKLPENRKGRPRRHEVRGRSRGGRRLTGTDESGTRGTAEVAIKEDLPKHTVSLAKRHAKARRDKRREHAFEGHISILPAFSGSSILMGQSLQLAGLGRFYSGVYDVLESRHEFRPGGLTNELSLGRDLK